MVNTSYPDPAVVSQEHYTKNKNEDASPWQIEVATRVANIRDPDELTAIANATFAQQYSTASWTPTIIGFTCNPLLDPETGGTLLICDLIPEGVRKSLFGMFDLPLHIERQLVADPAPQIRAIAAKQPGLEESSYIRLSVGASDEVFLGLIDNESMLYVSVFENIIELGSPRIRRALAFRDRLPTKIQIALANDISKDVLTVILQRNTFNDEAKTLAALRVEA